MAKPELVLLPGDRLLDPEAMASFIAALNGEEVTPELTEEVRREFADLVQE